MNESYTGFADVYDMFMDNVPYEKWALFITEYLKSRGIDKGLVADLGCGTGIITRLLKNAGYDMIGIDKSEEMLEIAREAEFSETEEEILAEEEENYPETNPGILYLCQDMREFELYGTVDVIVSVCDSMNYLTDPQDLEKVFRLANNYLEKGGYLIFDLNTSYKYRQLLKDNTFAEDRDEAAFIWDNFYDEESRINEYALTLFKETEGGLFEREQEIHQERNYSLSEIKEMLERAGMEFTAAYGDYELSEKMTEGDDLDCKKAIERMVIIAREKYQPGKFYEDK